MKHFIVLSVFFCACQLSPPNQQSASLSTISQTHTENPIICPGEMLEPPTDSIPTDLFAPENREDICDWRMPDDTVTAKGIFVKYLISNDTCCRDNLYIQWGNAKFQNIEALSPLRQFHPKMNPRYVGESDEYLFMESAASGGLPIVGWNFWLFPLALGRHSEVYATVAPEAYDLKSLTIIREVEVNRTEYHFLEAYNIKTQRVKPIKFKNRLSAASPTWALDSISVTPRTIFLSLEVQDDNGEIVTEKIILPNDIK
jgi:hypothetical protein